jgi:hypothetical protein
MTIRTPSMLPIWSMYFNIQYIKNYMPVNPYKLKIIMCSCSLSLWRVARGSKLMRLELIHGFFITWTEFRLSTTFILIIIIMHIYNWYHSITASILLYTRDENRFICTRYIPLAIFSPCWFPLLLPCLTLLNLLGTLLAVTGFVHLVPRLLVN